MTILFAGLDHIASLRHAGGGRDPDPVVAAALAELAGTGGISLTCGRDRTGLEERDLRLLREVSRTAVNVCLPPQDEFVKLALDVRPDLVTLIPEGHDGPGMERGLDVEDRRSELAPIIQALRAAGMAVSVRVDPAPAQVKAAHRLGVDAVWLYTGGLSWVGDLAARAAEFEGLVNAAKVGHKLRLAVHAGGGLGYQTVGSVTRILEIEAIHIGYSLIARAALVGMAEAVRELLRAMDGPPGPRTPAA
jgi:pyridoxine 5-phosphate synthase